MLRATRALLLLLAACAAGRPSQPLPTAASTAAEPFPLVLVGTSDLHGWVHPHEQTMADGTVVRWGGLAAFGGQVEILRRKHPDGVVLLDAGDLFQGTLIANLSEGEAVIAAYNALGYDAVALGNHELDYGPQGPRSYAFQPGDDPFGVLRARAAQAAFPFLARNVLLEDGTRPPFLDPDGLTVVTRRGVRIGIAALATPSTPDNTLPSNVRLLRFGSLLESAREAARALDAAGAEVRVLVVHEGGRCEDLSDPRSLASCGEEGELVPLLQALPHGLFDAVVGGHTHWAMGHFVNGMPVIQSFAHGTAFGVIELLFDPSTRRPIPSGTRILPAVPICERVFSGTDRCDPAAFRPGRPTEPARFLGEEVVAHARVQAAIEPFLQRAERLARQRLGVHLPETLSRAGQGEIPLGSALADALRAMEGADVALLNAGGLRADLPAGELTYGALFAAIPFDNAIATLSVTGAELKALLAALLAHSRGAPQVSGLRLAITRCPGKARLRSVSLENGRPLEPRRLYRVATLDYLALGGDGLAPLVARLPPERIDLGLSGERSLRDTLAAFLSQRGGTLTAPPKGRVHLTWRDVCPRRKPRKDRFHRTPSPRHRACRMLLSRPFRHASRQAGMDPCSPGAGRARGTETRK